MARSVPIQLAVLTCVTTVHAHVLPQVRVKIYFNPLQQSDWFVFWSDPSEYELKICPPIGISTKNNPFVKLQKIDVPKCSTIAAPKCCFDAKSKKTKRQVIAQHGIEPSSVISQCSVFTAKALNFNYLKSDLSLQFQNWRDFSLM